MEKFETPVEALDESQLEKISGGEVSSMPIDAGISSYLMYSQLASAIITPFVPMINAKATELQLKDTKKVLATYYTSTLRMDELCVFYANSWNERHPGLDPIDANIAAYILVGLRKKPDLQAQIALLPTRDDMVETLNQIFPGANLV